MVKVQIVLEKGVQFPAYATPGSAGVDVRANIKEPMILKPGQRALIPTGMKLSLPQGYEVQIRPRSGLAINYGITVLNTPGTCDQDFIYEYKVILINHGEKDYEIKPQERIAQMILKKVEFFEFEQVEKLEQTERKGGFGSSGRI